MKGRWSVPAAALVLAACTADSAPPTAARTTDGIDYARVVSITGGDGTAQLPAGFSPLTFSFSARLNADGSAAGDFSQHFASASGSTDFDGRVTCVAFDAALGRAWIGGVITANRSTNPARQGGIFEPGREAWFRVVDNGEGSGAVDDRLTVLGFEGGAGILTSAEYCATKAWTPGDANTWAVVDGNIQVNP